MTKTNQDTACPTRYDHCRDLFRGELSIKQVILFLKSCIVTTRDASGGQFLRKVVGSFTYPGYKYMTMTMTMTMKNIY